MKPTKSKQSYINKIKKNHKTDVEVSQLPGTTSLVVKFTFSGAGVYNGQQICRTVNDRGRVIRCVPSRRRTACDFSCLFHVDPVQVSCPSCRDIIDTATAKHS